jgi:hypothetical protein
MRKTLFVYALAAALALPLAAAQAQTPVSVSEAEGGRIWFVELSGAPTADGNTLAAVQSEKAAFRKAAAAAGISYAERRSFDVLFNGLSIAIAPSERLKLSRLSGVKALYPVEIIQAPIVEKTNAGAAPDLATAIAMTGADVAQNTLGLSGAGVKVAVMDTGIDIDHPDLGGSGVPGTTPFPSARVTHGWDFVGDAYNADPASPSYNPVPTPDAIPDDCAGHGTHVAGIVGANGQVKGVAPGRDLRRLPCVRLPGLDRIRHHAGRDGTCAGRRHAGAQHEHRLFVPVAAIPDGAGFGPPRQQGRCRRRFDRQQRRRRPVHRRRSGRRQEGDRCCVVREHPHHAEHLHDLARQHRDRVYAGRRRAAAADLGHLSDGAHRTVASPPTLARHCPPAA